MGRAYAGILGPLAMAVVICRGWLIAGGVDGTLMQASMCLGLFAVVGAILGHLAQTTVEESVRVKLQAELEK